MISIVWLLIGVCSFSSKMLLKGITSGGMVVPSKYGGSVKGSLIGFSWGILFLRIGIRVSSIVSSCI
jgi:hypothetical protein